MVCNLLITHRHVILTTRFDIECKEGLWRCCIALGCSTDIFSPYSTSGEWVGAFEELTMWQVDACKFMHASLYTCVAGSFI